MMKQTFHLNESVALQELFDFCAKRRAASPQYVNVDDAMIYQAYKEACRHDLRYNRKTNVLRDNRLGVLQRPSVSSDWEECSPEETRENLMREVWCNAVRDFNLARMA